MRLQISRWHFIECHLLVSFLITARQYNRCQSNVITCNCFAAHFRSKIEAVRQGLDSFSDAADRIGVSNALSCRVLLYQFQLVTPEGVDKALACSKATNSQL